MSSKLRSRGGCQPGTASAGERARSCQPTFHDIRGQPGPSLQGQRGSSALPFPPVYRGPLCRGWMDCQGGGVSPRKAARSICRAATGCPQMETAQTANDGEMTYYTSVHTMEYYTVLQNDVYKPFLEKLGSRLNGRRTGHRMVDTCDLFLDTFAYNLYSVCMGIALKIFKDTDKVPKTDPAGPPAPSHTIPLSPCSAAFSHKGRLSAPQHTQTSF